MTELLKILGGIAALYLLIAVALYLGQRRILYFPDPTPPDLVRAGVEEMRPVHLETEDGISLLSWWYPPAREDKGTIVYFHGNAGNIGYRGFKLRPYIDRGLGVLILGYRGYGGNEGRPTEQGLYRDGRAALAFVERQGITRDRTVLYGESLGTGVAVALGAAERYAALVLEAPFTSITDVAAYHYPWLPVRGLVRDRFDSLSRIGAVAAPVLILHGDRDTVIPAAFGRRLHDAASPPKEIVVVAEAGHEDLYLHGAAATVLAFLARLGLA